MTRWKSAAVLCAFLVSAGGMLSADNVRGPFRAAIDLSPGRTVPGPLSLAMEEIVSIDPGTDLRFYKALEIAVDLPPAFLEYGDSFGVFIYGTVTPLSTGDAYATYRGTRLLTVPFHFRQKLFIRIPLRKAVRRDASPDTVTYEGVPDLSAYPLLVTILPIMKGVPSALYETRFPFTARLVPAGEGSLSVRITDRAGKKLEGAAVQLGGKALPDPTGEQILKPGIYTLDVAIPGYRSERRTVTVEEAKQTVAEFQLTAVSTSILFEAPRDAVIYLDGERISHAAGAPVAVQDGPHSVILKVGDYQVTRNFTVLPGKTYKISVFLDFSVEEF